MGSDRSPEHGLSAPDSVADPEPAQGQPSAVMASSLVGGAAAGLTGGTELAIAVGAAAPAVQAVIQPLLERWGRAIADLLSRADPSGGRELAEHLERHPKAASLLMEAAEATARTDYDLKIETIGRAIASGVLYEEGVKFDTEAELVRVISRIDRIHVAALCEISHYLNGVTVEQLAQTLPQLSEPMNRIVAELSSLGLTEGGLASDDDDHRRPSLGPEHHRVTRLGGRVLDRYLHAAEALDVEVVPSNPNDDGLHGLREYRGPIVFYSTLGGAAYGERPAFFYEGSGRQCPDCPQLLVHDGVQEVHSDESTSPRLGDNLLCPRCGPPIADTGEPV